MWNAETLRRNHSPAAPKEEWAFINFAQTYLKKSPTASKIETNQAWELERQKRKDEINEIMQKIFI